MTEVSIFLKDTPQIRNPMNHFYICTYNPKKIDLSWNMFDFPWFKKGEPTFFTDIWKGEPLQSHGKSGSKRAEEAAANIKVMKYLLLWKPGTDCLSHFLHVQIMWLPVSVRHVGGFNTSACLSHYRNDEGGVVRLQYIISGVFLYLKYIVLIFFFLFLHEPAERQLMLKLLTKLIYCLW